MNARACGWSLVLAAAAMGVPACDRSDGKPSPPLRSFGRTGAGAGEFGYPRAGAFFDRELYVVDKTGRIQVFSPGGETLRSWRMPDTSAGKPTGLCVGPDGRVFVADTHYARVMVYDREGRWLHAFGSFGTGPGQFRLPTDVAVDAAGFIYVSEYGGNDRISKFSPAFEFAASFSGAGEGGAAAGRPDAAASPSDPAASTPDAAASTPGAAASTPGAAANTPGAAANTPGAALPFDRPQSLLIDADGTLWVADACNHRICHLDADGASLRTFGSVGGALGELRFPYSIDRLSDGSLIVCEYGNNRVQRFSTDGRSLGAWGVAGRKPGELAYPWAAVVGGDDLIYVIDSGNNRVQVIDGRSAGTWR
ncbi:Serine/threonine-protein kinase PknD [Phycisphaerae bacterium RAS1]|nr:Serine/threonine-protein kinase PknD [Phycisphaerae bacterium RAS1]